MEVTLGSLVCLNRAVTEGPPRPRTGCYRRLPEGRVPVPLWGRGGAVRRPCLGEWLVRRSLGRDDVGETVAVRRSQREGACHAAQE